MNLNLNFVKSYEVNFNSNDWILSKYPLEHEIINHFFKFFL